MTHINPALTAPLAALVAVFPTAQVERTECGGSVVVVRTASTRLRLGLENGIPRICGRALMDETRLIFGTYSRALGWYFTTHQARRNRSSVLPR